MLRRCVSANALFAFTGHPRPTITPQLLGALPGVLSKATLGQRSRGKATGDAPALYRIQSTGSG